MAAVETTEDIVEGAEHPSDSTSPPQPTPCPPVDVSYPIKVIYCGECGMPPEYCEYGPCYDKCKLWLENHLPELASRLNLIADDITDEDKKKRQTRGGKALVKSKKKSDPQMVKIYRVHRNKKKYVTMVTGLKSFDIDLKVATKLFAKKFAGGSSITNTDEIVVQGDVSDELYDLIIETWSEIDDDKIQNAGDAKR